MGAFVVGCAQLRVGKRKKGPARRRGPAVDLRTDAQPTSQSAASRVRSLIWCLLMMISCCADMKCPEGSRHSRKCKRSPVGRTASAAAAHCIDAKVAGVPMRKRPLRFCNVCVVAECLSSSASGLEGAATTHRRTSREARARCNCPQSRRSGRGFCSCRVHHSGVSVAPPTARKCTDCYLISNIAQQRALKRSANT